MRGHGTLEWFAGRRSARRSTAALSVVALSIVAISIVAFLGAAPHARAGAAKIRIQGASRVFPAAWGLVAQGSGMLRILPAGKTAWQTVHAVKGDSLYRVAFDDAGRLLATWEHEPHFHLFVPKQNQHLTFAKPPAPSPEFKYGYNVGDLHFSKDGKGAIVYMTGFLGGRRWATVAYHFALDGRSPPTLLYQQPGYSWHNTSRLAIYALPQNDNDACEDNSCYPLGAIIAWEISGATATKRVLLSGAPNNKLSRIRPVWTDEEERVALVLQEHPRGRHLLRWRAGEATAEFRPLPDGPDYDTMDMRLTRSGDVVESWLTAERGLEVRRYALGGGQAKVRLLPPHPKRTPHDHPLFGINASTERKNGDFVVFWGEYLIVLPAGGGPARRLDLRAASESRSEFSGLAIYVAAPEGFWIARDVGRAFDFAYLPFSDFDKRATALP